MSRAERRRAEKEQYKAKTATYNVTKQQLDELVKKEFGEEIERAKQEATDEAVNQALILLFILPLEVLMDHFWIKSYQKRIPEFTKYLLEYYEKWQNGEIDMEMLKKDLWEYGGVKFKEAEEIRE